MKIMTLVGTRPELIRLSIIIKKLDCMCDHILVDTKQNNTYELSDIFYKELEIRQPNYKNIKLSQTLSEQLFNSFSLVEEVIKLEHPDKVLILGDTNTSLAALIVERMGVPVYHMEAGNRSYNMNTPEEINRKIIDITASYNLPYTEKSKENLLRCGIHPNKIFVTGNPIYEVMRYYSKNFIITKKEKTLLITCHRQETVDNKDTLLQLINAFNQLSDIYKIIFPMHPRTLDKIKQFKIKLNFYPVPPMSFIPFLKNEMEASIILTDSGTVQEEACILNKPCVVLRDSTERIETVESGNTIITGINTNSILNATKQLLNYKQNGKIPQGYKINNVSTIVTNYLIGKQI